jgi:hypothetical protein
VISSSAKDSSQGCVGFLQTFADLSLPAGQRRQRVKDEFGQRPLIPFRFRTIIRDDEAIDGVLDRRQLPGKLPGHRVRPTNPQRRNKASRWRAGKMTGV